MRTANLRREIDLADSQMCSKNLLGSGRRCASRRKFDLVPGFPTTARLFLRRGTRYRSILRPFACRFDEGLLSAAVGIRESTTGMTRVIRVLGLPMQKLPLLQILKPACWGGHFPHINEHPTQRLRRMLPDTAIRDGQAEDMRGTAPEVPVLEGEWQPYVNEVGIASSFPIENMSSGHFLGFESRYHEVSEFAINVR